MLDLQYPFHALASSPSKGARKPGAKREIIEMSTAYDLAIAANVSPAARRLRSRGSRYNATAAEQPTSPTRRVGHSREAAESFRDRPGK